MKLYLSLLILMTISMSCQEKNEEIMSDPVNWDKRKVSQTLPDSLSTGKTYLSVYSQIYSQTEFRTHDLTATVSVRNTNLTDTIYISKADYYDTKGKLIRNYIKQLIFIAPMETVAIVINEADQDGGIGANFLFEWQTKAQSNEPLFEGVMISTSGQQGLSFTTQGKRIK